MSIFCYGPQRRAVEELLRRDVALGHHDIHPVDEHSMNRLRGMEDITFVIDVGHGAKVPERIYNELRIYGAVLWNLDDSFMRARYTRERK